MCIKLALSPDPLGQCVAQSLEDLLLVNTHTRKESRALGPHLPKGVHPLHGWFTGARSWTPTLISFWQSFSPEVKAGGAQRPGNARPLLTHSPLTWRCRESSVQGAQGSLWIRAWRESLLPPAAILAQLGKLQSQIRVGGNLSSPPLADR